MYTAGLESKSASILVYSSSRVCVAEIITISEVELQNDFEDTTFDIIKGIGPSGLSELFCMN